MNESTAIQRPQLEEGFVNQGFEAWVVPAPGQESIKVATLALDERWVRGFKAEKALAGRLDSGGVKGTLEGAVRPVVIASGSWAFDQYAVEAVVENASACEPNEVLVPSAPGLSLPPVCVVGVEAAKLLATLDDVDYSSQVDKAVEWLRGQEGVTLRELPLEGSYWGKVTSQAEAKEATWSLLKRLQYRPGGLVAIYMNRPISIRFSKLIVDTGITPNQTTFAAFVVGVIGVALLFLGGWAWAVAGTFLLHVNSIWDGIDGELARMRYQSSDFGAYLDSVCDEILNAAIIIAAAFHIVWFMNFPEYWIWLGLFGGGSAFLYALVHWHCKWKHGLGLYWWWEAYKPRKQVQRSKSAWFYFKKLFCKDSILLLFFVAAVFQFMHVLVLASAIMGVVNVVLLFIHIVIMRARW
mgnify:CR=1 FL=1